MADQLTEYFESKYDEAAEVLMDLIRFPSTAGNEGPVAEYLYENMQGFCDETEYIEITNEIKEDRDYASPVRGLEYGDRPNVRVAQKGSGGGKSLIFNTHMDVVPPSATQERPFDPYLEDGIIYGRGACDAKGQLTTLYLVLQAIEELDIDIGGDVIGHLVIEEENGGNGTIAMARTGETADAAINLEPSNFILYPQIRGAVWFETTIYGRSGHSGTPGGTISALEKAIRATHIFRAYHDVALAESRGQYPMFDGIADPAPLTIGEMKAGDWPAQSPQKAVFTGVLGILPDRTKEDVMKHLNEMMAGCDDDWLAENFEIEFTYRHDASIIPPDHPVVQTLEAACTEGGVEPEVSAMTASSDAWWYTNQLDIPTCWFGGGDLGVAHSNNENIPVTD
ncbi:MAG: M20 family metallopeptidase, partial [Armatimonadota bacterium]